MSLSVGSEVDETGTIDRAGGGGEFREQICRSPSEFLDGIRPVRNDRFRVFVTAQNGTTVPGPFVFIARAVRTTDEREKK